MAKSSWNPIDSAVAGTAVIHKRALFAEQKGGCAGCGIALPYAYFEVDHIHPRAKGGGDERSNLQMLCTPCNRHKMVRRQSEFMSTFVHIKDQPAFKARESATDENVLKLETALAVAEEEIRRCMYTIRQLQDELSDVRDILHDNEQFDDDSTFEMLYDIFDFEDSDARLEHHLKTRQAERNAPFVDS